IDTTDGMADDISAIRGSMTEVTDYIASHIPDFRIAVVDYQDFNKPNIDANITIPYGWPDNYPFSTVLGFTSDTGAIVDAINSLTVYGGADVPESVYAGLMHCIDHNAIEVALAPNEPNLFGADPNAQGPGEWRGGDVTRVVVLIGDAPPHDPEPFTEFTIGDVVSAARGKSINIFSVPIGTVSGTVESFTDLAERTEGLMIRASGAGEVVGAIMATIKYFTRTTPPVYVESGCTLTGWDSAGESWDPNTHNIGEDPAFAFGYYLSQLDAGQMTESNCVDGGSDLASNLGMDIYTTRTDGFNDVNVVDMGFHYGKGFTWYYMTVTVLEDPCDPGIHGYVEPNSAIIYEGYSDNVITLIAYPDCNRPDYCYRVKEWTGTDNDSSTSFINTVTVTENTSVTVEFEPLPRHELTVVVGDHGSVVIEPDRVSYLEGEVVTLRAIPDSGYRLQQWSGTDSDWSSLNTNTVTMTGPKTVTITFAVPQFITVGPGGDYATIQEGVNAARMGDTVVVYEGIYTAPYSYYYDPNTYESYIDTATSGIDFEGKSITLRSINPQATVIIDCQKTGRAFYFHSGEDANAVVSNIIIRNGYVHGPVGAGGLYGGGQLLDPNDPNSEPDPNAGAGGDAFGDAYGGGIYCTNGSSPTFSDCTITNCLVAGAVGGAGGDGLHTPDEHGDGGPGGMGYGVGYGGAIACTENSNPTFTNCTIIKNRAVGGVAGLGGEGAIDIEDAANSGSNGMRGVGAGDGVGGGIYARNSTPKFTDCLISDNIASDSDDIVRTSDVDFFNEHILA
ncbi:MAG: InlB B-repeat-containing protein, partial [Planctomycetota bacterium]